MSKKVAIRQMLEDMEASMGIPHDVTLSDEDRLIVVVSKIYHRLMEETWQG